MEASEDLQSRLFQGDFTRKAAWRQGKFELTPSALKMASKTGKRREFGENGEKSGEKYADLLLLAKKMRGVWHGHIDPISRHIRAVPHLHDKRSDVPHLSYQQKDLPLSSGERPRPLPGQREENPALQDQDDGRDSLSGGSRASPRTLQTA